MDALIINDLPVIIIFSILMLCIYLISTEKQRHAKDSEMEFGAFFAEEFSDLMKLRGEDKRQDEINTQVSIWSFFLIIIALVFPYTLTAFGEKATYACAIAILGFISSFFRSLPYLYDEEDLYRQFSKSLRYPFLWMFKGESSVFLWVHCCMIIVAMLFVSIVITQIFPDYAFTIMDTEGNLNLQMRFFSATGQIFTALIAQGILILPISIYLSGIDSKDHDIKKEIKRRVVVLSLIFLAITLVLGLLGATYLGYES